MSSIPPDEIDQAPIIEFVILRDYHIATGNTKHYIEGKSFDDCTRLAICKYDEDPGLYLFYCDDEWNLINDTYHESIEIAKDQAEFEFKGTLNDWVRK